MVSKIFKTLIGLLLIPLVLGVSKAFYSQISQVSLFSHTLHVMERGILAYVVFHVLVIRPTFVYVLGHELVHVLATWLCGGQVVSFNVSPSGGNVVTSKTNFFIELSPYFVPLYTILLGVLFFVMNETGYGGAKVSALFVFFVGVTLAFHFVMTSEILRIEQPDIMKSGLVFSLMTILVGNLIVVMAVFCPMFSGVSFMEFLRSSADNSMEYYRIAYAKASSFINSTIKF